MEGLTYLAMIVGWSAPIIALHWAVGWRVLVRKRAVLAVATGGATLYLGLADTFAIQRGIWAINPEKTIGSEWHGFVFEEWLFFFVTNLIVAQTAILLSDAGMRAKAKAFVIRS